MLDDCLSDTLLCSVGTPPHPAGHSSLLWFLQLLPLTLTLQVLTLPLRVSCSLTCTPKAFDTHLFFPASATLYSNFVWPSNRLGPSLNFPPLMPFLAPRVYSISEFQSLYYVEDDLSGSAMYLTQWERHRVSRPRSCLQLDAEKSGWQVRKKSNTHYKA